MSKNGDWQVKAGEVFQFKGFDCLIIRTSIKVVRGKKKYYDTLKIDGKFHELSREDWIKKFSN
ncbi:hypothetical protein GO491_11865 [Flavobacteriaceae bacterium Ap0902]|nr:hypothetical protein [Flavobacteriaceae bacterium Ap0902]